MITRQKLIDQIEKYKPYNEQEEKDKILILDWIRNNENAFSREKISSDTGRTLEIPASSFTSLTATDSKSVSPSACPPSQDQELYML